MTRARRRPKHQAQLGRGTLVPGSATRGTRDCGPRSWQMGIDAQTRGVRRPGVGKLRRHAGAIGPRATTFLHARRAIDGMAVPDRTRLRYYIRRRLADVRQAVRAGRPVHLGIDYGRFGDLMGGTVGDPAFRGGHSVLVCGQRQRRGRVEWRLFDPLDDGRTPRTPKGPRWVPRAALTRAAVVLANGDPDRIWAGVFGGGGPRPA